MRHSSHGEEGPQGRGYRVSQCFRELALEFRQAIQAKPALMGWWQENIISHPCCHAGSTLFTPP